MESGSVDQSQSAALHAFSARLAQLGDTSADPEGVMYDLLEACAALPSSDHPAGYRMLVCPAVHRELSENGILFLSVYGLRVLAEAEKLSAFKDVLLAVQGWTDNIFQAAVFLALVDILPKGDVAEARAWMDQQSLDWRPSLRQVLFDEDDLERFPVLFI